MSEAGDGPLGVTGERRHTWDEKAREDFLAWHAAGPSESELDAVSELISMLEEGYLAHGAIESSQSESAVRGDGKTVDVYGHTLAGSLRLFVGVCEETGEVRTLILGPCDKRAATRLAMRRVKRWESADERQ